MSDRFTIALRERFAKKLGVEPQDILNVRVEWDNGDNYDPTYGSELTAPTFRVVVKHAAGTQTWISTSHSPSSSVLRWGFR